MEGKVERIQEIGYCPICYKNDFTTRLLDFDAVRDIDSNGLHSGRIVFIAVCKNCGTETEVDNLLSIDYIRDMRINNIVNE